MCQPCKKMRSHLDQRVRASLAVTPTKKAARLKPSSRCPLSALSPVSVNKRRENLMTERSHDNVINSGLSDALSEYFKRLKAKEKVV